MLTIALIGVVVFALCIGWMFGPGMCGHGKPTVLLSPNGRYQALTFEGDCGATDHFHTWVSILKAGKRLGEHDLGNTFGIEGHQRIETTWVDATHLLVRYAQGAKVQMRTDHVGDVSIRYAEETY